MSSRFLIVPSSTFSSQSHLVLHLVDLPKLEHAWTDDQTNLDSLEKVLSQIAWKVNMNGLVKRWWPDKLWAVGNMALSLWRRTRVVNITEEWSFVWWKVYMVKYRWIILETEEVGHLGHANKCMVNWAHKQAVSYGCSMDQVLILPEQLPVVWAVGESKWLQVEYWEAKDLFYGLTICCAQSSVRTQKKSEAHPRTWWMLAWMGQTILKNPEEWGWYISWAWIIVSSRLRRETPITQTHHGKAKAKGRKKNHKDETNKRRG